MDLGEYHHEQGFSNSCLAACITMTRLRTGAVTPSDAADHERALCEKLGAGRGGILIDIAADEIPSKAITVNLDSPTIIFRIQDDLASGIWWHIAILFSGVLAEHHDRLGLAASARHGPLPHPIGPGHAVVLVGSEPRGVLYLDPWLSRARQPQRMTTEVFAQAWNGMYIPVRVQ